MAIFRSKDVLRLDLDWDYFRVGTMGRALLVSYEVRHCGTKLRRQDVQCEVISSSRQCPSVLSQLTKWLDTARSKNPVPEYISVVGRHGLAVSEKTTPDNSHGDVLCALASVACA